MTVYIPETQGPVSPWHRYVKREHAARDAYLQVTHRAQHEYLAVA